jgi:hypothetical protein
MAFHTHTHTHTHTHKPQTNHTHTCTHTLHTRTHAHTHIHTHTHTHTLCVHKSKVHVDVVDDDVVHFYSALSILSNAHGAWPMFWPVLRRCHILR